MNIVYYAGSYYVQADNLSVILKITQGVGTLTTIEVVQVMPGYNYGTYVDPQDSIWLGVLDNLKAFIKELE